MGRRVGSKHAYDIIMLVSYMYLGSVIAVQYGLKPSEGPIY